MLKESDLQKHWNQFKSALDHLWKKRSKYGTELKGIAGRSSSEAARKFSLQSSFINGGKAKNGKGKEDTVVEAK